MFGTGTIRLSLLCIHWFFIISASPQENVEISKAYNSIKWNNYDYRIRPYGKNGTHETPTIVYTHITFNYIDNFDESKMEYKAQLTLRMNMQDRRLIYDNSTGKIKFLILPKNQPIWLPDVYFSNERGGYSHHVIAPNSLIKLYPNGEITYSNRLSLTFTCPMDLQLYPLDSQICSIYLTSLGHTADDFVLAWKPSDPFKISTSVRMWKYVLEQIRADDCSSDTGTVDFCYLKIDIFLKREINFYLKYFYFPYVLIVFSSWITFWLDRMIFVRLYISTSLLFIIILDLLFRPTEIPTSNTTALDVWINGCILFAFLAMLQNLFVACKVKKHFKRTTNAINLYTGAPLAKQEDLPEYLMTNISQNQNKSLGRLNLFWNKLKPKSVDTACQIIFPVCFVSFFLYYWMKYYFLPRM